jgi:hypothetical protein
VKKATPVSRNPLAMYMSRLTEKPARRKVVGPAGNLWLSFIKIKYQK